MDAQSETLSVDNGGSSFLIFLFGDPHSLEGWQWAEDRSSDPDQEFPLSRSNDLDLHGWWSKGSHFFAETFWDSWVHGCSTTHDDVAIKVFSDVNVALEDWLVGDFVETRHLFTDQHGLEESFRASESLGGDSDDLAVGKFVGLVVLGWAVIGYIGSEFTSNFSFEVKSNVAEFFLDVSDGLWFCWGTEVQSDFVEEFSHVFSEVSACQVVSLDGMRKSVSFIDRDSVSDTITSVKDESCGSSWGVEGEHSLDSKIVGRHFECFESDFGHLFSVGFWVTRS